MAPAVRHTVAPAVVGTVTSYIMWADAEHAAAIGAAPVSPYKPKSPTDREWTRRYNVARRCLSISGFTQSGLCAATVSA